MKLLRNVNTIFYSMHIVRKVIHLWDPEYTKVGPVERMRLKKADREVRRGIYYKESDIFS